MSLRQLQERVSVGALLLDHKNPGWASRIDVETLDIENDRNCVVAQLYRGDYNAGLQALGAYDNPWEYPRAVRFGFHCNEPDTQTRHAAYTALTRLWLGEIQMRMTPAEVRCEVDRRMLVDA